MIGTEGLAAIFDKQGLWLEFWEHNQHHAIAPRTTGHPVDLVGFAAEGVLFGMLRKRAAQSCVGCDKFTQEWIVENHFGEEIGRDCHYDAALQKALFTTLERESTTPEASSVGLDEAASYAAAYVLQQSRSRVPYRGCKGCFGMQLSDFPTPYLDRVNAILAEHDVQIRPARGRFAGWIVDVGDTQKGES